MLALLSKFFTLLSTCKYELVLLNGNFSFTRPLTVTGALLIPSKGVLFHQMVLDRIDDVADEYVIQNTLISEGGSVLRISKSNAYYANENLMLRNNPAPGEFKYYGRNGEFMWLVNERFANTMQPNKWYLLPQAYSLTLSRIE